jgi:hypothetical protein
MLALDWRGYLSSICLTEAELLKSLNCLEWNAVAFVCWISRSAAFGPNFIRHLSNLKFVLLLA